MKMKEFFYLIYYSFRSILDDFASLLDELKNPRTWSYILIAFFIITAYSGYYKLMVSIIPMMLIVKIIRDRIEGRFRHEMYIKDLMKGKDTELVLEHYKKYQIACEHKKLAPLPLKEWKEKEIRRKQNNTEED